MKVSLYLEQRQAIYAGRNSLTVKKINGALLKRKIYMVPDRQYTSSLARVEGTLRDSLTKCCLLGKEGLQPVGFGNIDVQLGLARLVFN